MSHLQGGYTCNGEGMGAGWEGQPGARGQLVADLVADLVAAGTWTAASPLGYALD